ncbi:hypothetical protein TVAG_491130 [Trichomonas vaginalis G3]|uniref:Hemerythrin-like domain-containing protein n=1 Tax=Trichomonas vaginalis (strain ATCC PRA-98 / G3) TaxID=412133 RepID=A2E056_TRIV3|nr:protein of unknown function (DUF542) [Trichomonas vaginalis G3]EAY13975.1 hypothetical protein TVAG_491130 [Trichomonas vaginalis G3]KAI5551793.1 protein of unknown function (DUF542) [Trichomonas vaginalis G3]|eukprot:XP_001326198.1 hypothetical protein [Trichomonas vaginalis G3]
MESFGERTVGSIVAESFKSASTFAKFGIDFCCHGYNKLNVACKEAGVSLEDVYNELNKPAVSGSAHAEFSTWPLDLLVDYVLKIHHRGIRKNAPNTQRLLSKVDGVHGEHHPELHEVKKLFNQSIDELTKHLAKEEEMLFPYIVELFNASETGTQIAPNKYGSVQSIIDSLKTEHEAEGSRYFHLAKITNNYTCPPDGCNSFRLVYQQIHDFVDALFEHIHIENNIIFPLAIELEKKYVKKEE